MTLMRAFLVEDEPPARARLRRLLSPHPDISVVGEAEDAPRAIAVLDQQRPDLVFLDVQLPGGSGLEVLRSLTYRPHLVFVTAYADYAVYAFEANAVDYLLKPVEAERLGEALARVRSRATPGFSPEVLRALTTALEPRAAPVSIPVRAGEGFSFVRLDHVTHFEAKDKYVFAHTVEGKAYLLDRSLAALSERLPPHFVQVHRAVIINRHHLCGVTRHLGGRYVLCLGEDRGVRIITGPTYAAAVEEALRF